MFDHGCSQNQVDVQLTYRYTFLNPMAGDRNASSSSSSPCHCWPCPPLVARKFVVTYDVLHARILRLRLSSCSSNPDEASGDELSPSGMHSVYCVCFCRVWSLYVGHSRLICDFWQQKARYFRRWTAPSYITAPCRSSITCYCLMARISKFRLTWVE